MRRNRMLIYLLFAVVIVVGIGAFLLLQGGGGLTGAPAGTPTSAVRVVKVIVAGQSIPRGTAITEEMLATIELPETSLVSVMKTDPAEVVGKLAKYPLEQGVPITSAVLVDNAAQLAQTGSEAAKLIPPGLTAISIPISRLSSVAYAIQDGDRVDVIASMLFVDVDPSFQSTLPNVTYTVGGTGFIQGSLPVLTTSVTPDCSKTTDGTLCSSAGGPQGRVELDPTLNQAFYVGPRDSQRPRLVSQRIIQNVQVLKIGSFALAGQTSGQQSQAPTATPQPGQPAPATSGVERPDIITLIVTPQDAVTLTYLIYSNTRLTLTLRGIDDQTRVDTEATTLQFLLSQYAIPVPAKLPYALEPRVDQLIPPTLPNDIITTTP